MRARQTDPWVTPDDLKFTFFTTPRAGIEPYTNEQIVIHRPAGFDASAIYEFTFEARDLIVMGLAFASVRVLISFLRNDSEDAAGNANPLLLGGKPATRFTYGMGISQSGRFVRDLLYQGFNEDEQGRMVFDALMPDVAGSRKTWTKKRLVEKRLLLEDDVKLYVELAVNVISGANEEVQRQNSMLRLATDLY